MRSEPRVVPALRSDRIVALLAEVEAAAGGLSAVEALEAIGRTGRLEAVLRARYAALAVGPPPPSARSDEPRYLDVRQAATYLGISVPTVSRLTKAGVLPCSRPSSGTVRYDRTEVDAYMSSRKMQLAPDD